MTFVLAYLLGGEYVETLTYTFVARLKFEGFFFLFPGKTQQE